MAGHAQTLSEPSGLFEIKGVPGRQAPDRRHPSRLRPRRRVVDVVAAKDRRIRASVLTQGGRIEGVARKRDGTPLAGLEVPVYSSAGPGGGGAPQPHHAQRWHLHRRTRGALARPT